MVGLRLIRFWIAAAVGTAAVVLAPDCQSTAPTQNTLFNIQTANLTVPTTPFEIVYAKDDIAFDAIADGGVAVLNISTFSPIPIREIPLPVPFYQRDFAVAGLAITRGKRTVFVVCRSRRGSGRR